MASAKEKELARKLEEADKAMDNFLSCLQGLGETGRVKISLLIQEAKDGKTDTGRL